VNDVLSELWVEIGWTFPGLDDPGDLDATGCAEAVEDAGASECTDAEDEALDRDGDGGRDDGVLLHAARNAAMTTTHAQRH
jgi:hypothetical protein